MFFCGPGFSIVEAGLQGDIVPMRLGMWIQEQQYRALFSLMGKGMFKDAGHANRFGQGLPGCRMFCPGFAQIAGNGHRAAIARAGYAFIGIGAHVQHNGAIR